MKESLENDFNQENNNLINNDINNKIDLKYKELFDKYKDENNLISKNDLKKILSENGIQITLEQSEELIKNLNKNENDKLNLNKFAELMENVNLQETNDNKTLSNFKIFLLFILLALGSTIVQISIKILNKLETLNQLFEGHHFFIIFCMFLGEFLCLIIYYIHESLFTKKNEEENGPKKHLSLYYFLLLAILNIISNIIVIFALSYLVTVIYEMCNAFIIFLTFLASIIYLKKKYYRHHFLSIILITLGASLNGYYSKNSNKVLKNKSLGLGIFLIILAKIIISFFYAIEEKILKDYDYNPLKAVGLEGMWGFFIYGILLIFFQKISCDNWGDSIKESVCTVNDIGKYHIEDSIFAFRQLYNRKFMILCILGYILGVILYNSSRLIIIKNKSAVFCLVMISLCNFTWYIISLILDGKFNWLIFIGFTILLLGCFIYFEILVIPFFGLGDGTKKSIYNKKKILEKDILLLNLNMSNNS